MNSCGWTSQYRQKERIFIEDYVTSFDLYLYMGFQHERQHYFTQAKSVYYLELNSLQCRFNINRKDLLKRPCEEFPSNLYFFLCQFNIFITMKNKGDCIVKNWSPVNNISVSDIGESIFNNNTLNNESILFFQLVEAEKGRK